MSADPARHPDRGRAHRATETLAAGAIFVGAPIEHASEREVVAEVADQLDRRGTPYVLLANFEVGGRQIDCVIGTTDAVVVVEAKAAVRSWRPRPASERWCRAASHQRDLAAARDR